MKTYLEVVTDALLANDLKQARYLLENEFSFNQIFSRMAVASVVKRDLFEALTIAEAELPWEFFLPDC